SCADFLSTGGGCGYVYDVFVGKQIDFCSLAGLRLMKLRHAYAFLPGAALALFVSSCHTVGPDYVGPQTRVPDAWSRNVLRDLQGNTPLTGWWKGFHDPTLNTLIERARQANPDLKKAVARLSEARAQRGIARSQGLPQANASASY